MSAYRQQGDEKIGIQLIYNGIDLRRALGAVPKRRALPRLSYKLTTFFGEKRGLLILFNTVLF